MRTRVGMITPSLNTVVEPITYGMLVNLPEITVHFTRVSVTSVSLDEQSDAQFAEQPMIDAANLLIDAKVDVICWNGTSGGWRGLKEDADLCAAVSDAVNVPVTSASQAIVSAFKQSEVTRYGLVTPYFGDMQNQIISNYSNMGFECVGEAHLNHSDGFSYAGIDEKVWALNIKRVAESKPQAITTMCTNIDWARLAQDLEKETGVLLIDSVSATLWAALKLAGIDPSLVRSWGDIFRLN